MCNRQISHYRAQLWNLIKFQCLRQRHLLIASNMSSQWKKECLMWISNLLLVITTKKTMLHVGFKPAACHHNEKWMPHVGFKHATWYHREKRECLKQVSNLQLVITVKKRISHVGFEHAACHQSEKKKVTCGFRTYVGYVNYHKALCDKVYVSR